MCVLVRFHGAKSMIGFSTILCVSDELFHTIGVAFLIDRIVARIHDNRLTITTTTFKKGSRLNLNHIGETNSLSKSCINLTVTASVNST